MTVAEYKDQHPENAHLEGDALWNAMEDALLAKMPCRPQRDIELSPEDEEEYQKAKRAQEEAWAEYGVKSINYTRSFWQEWDKIQTNPGPLTSACYIIFDVSEGSTKCWDVENNEYPNLDALLEAKKKKDNGGQSDKTGNESPGEGTQGG